MLQPMIEIFGKTPTKSLQTFLMSKKLSKRDQLIFLLKLKLLLLLLKKEEGSFRIGRLSDQITVAQSD